LTEKNPPPEEKKKKDGEENERHARRNQLMNLPNKANQKGVFTIPKKNKEESLERPKELPSQNPTAPTPK